MRDQAKEQAFQAALETAQRLAALDNRIAGDFPAYVFSPGRMARQFPAVASCLLAAGAARASTGAARPGSPQEGAAAPVFWTVG
jgi:hypothetical protein